MFIALFGDLKARLAFRKKRRPTELRLDNCSNSGFFLSLRQFDLASLFGLFVQTRFLSGLPLGVLFLLPAIRIKFGLPSSFGLVLDSLSLKIEKFVERIEYRAFVGGRLWSLVQWRAFREW
jgi:hypothetical protein